MDESISEKLKILWTTDGFTPHAIAASPKVGDELRQRVAHILSSLDGMDPVTGTKALLGIDGFEVANDEDWDDVRALGLSTILAQ